jgi:hypothetical protein
METVLSLSAGQTLLDPSTCDLTDNTGYIDGNETA